MNFFIELPKVNTVLVEFVKNFTKAIFIRTASFKGSLETLCFKNALIKSAQLILDYPKEDFLRILTLFLERLNKTIL